MQNLAIFALFAVFVNVSAHISGSVHKRAMLVHEQIREHSFKSKMSAIASTAVNILSDDIPSGASGADGYTVMTSYSEDNCGGTPTFTFGFAMNVCFNEPDDGTSFKYFLCAEEEDNCVMGFLYSDFDCQTVSQTRLVTTPNCTSAVPNTFYTSVGVSVTVGTEIDIPVNSVLLRYFDATDASCDNTVYKYSTIATDVCLEAFMLHGNSSMYSCNGKISGDDDTVPIPIDVTFYETATCGIQFDSGSDQTGCVYSPEDDDGNNYDYYDITCVAGPDDSDDAMALSDGGIAGVVIGGAVVLGLIAFAVYYFAFAASKGVAAGGAGGYAKPSATGVEVKTIH